MKKFTLLVAAIAVCGSINAQKQDVIIDDFENGNMHSPTNYTSTL